MPNDQQTELRFVVGLGNPGRQYERTRHNVGFMVLAELAGRWGLGQPGQRFAGLFYDARLEKPAGRRRVMMLAPQTYMNLSGQAVGQMAGFYKADCRNVMIVLDDLALATGRIRIRPDGSAGGHNGLADVLLAMGTQEVPRLRIGIGQAPGGMDQADYVLSRFGPEEIPAVEQAVKLAAQAVEDWIWTGMDQVMNRYNSKADQAGAAGE
ncbi:MAG: aminoacyl-tRNA hydrolase [Planctomycetes bacterium]|nr:aminoacyl-tRNA hydrolase [Planctomycetota bacterium]